MIELKNICFKYHGNDEPILENINLKIKKGEIVAILGPSGAGKSTLLKCINGLLKPSSGEILVEGKNMFVASHKKTMDNNKKIGMIFQTFNLAKRRNVLANVLQGRLPYSETLKSCVGFFSKEDNFIALNSLKRVGLEGFLTKRVSELSGGQMQRVAIARALAQEPEYILADEPVSNLDIHLIDSVMNLLEKNCIENQITLITSLHYVEVAKKFATRIIGLRDGIIVFDGKPEQLNDKNIEKIYGKIDKPTHILVEEKETGKKKKRAIILAAGSSPKLLPLTKNKPKCMLKVGGRPIIGHVVDSIEMAGANEVVVVTGYKGETIRKFFGERTICLHNPFFDSTSILGSLWFAREYLNGEFIFSYADTLYDYGLPKQLMSSEHDITLAVSKIRLDKGSEKVELENGMVKRISKNIPFKKATGEFIGIAKFSGKGTALLRNVLEEMSKEKNFHKNYFTAAIERLISKKHKVFAIVSDNEWIDIDSAEDYEKAVKESGKIFGSDR